jgi:hypothetical protein
MAIHSASKLKRTIVKALVFSSVFISCSALLSACAGLTQMQDTAAKFDQAVHSATTAELTLFDQVRAAECRRNFFRNGFDFATAERDRATGHYQPLVKLDLRANTCVNQELPDDELAIRQKLMSTITLYADSIQTLTNGTSDTSLSDDANKLAGNIKTLATQQKFPAADVTGVAALNTAIVTLTTMILDHASYKHVKAAADAMQKPLSDVVDALKKENSADAVGLASKADALADEVKTGVDSARDHFGPASFLNIIYARESLQSLIVTLPNITQLNSTLDSIVAANGALARSTNGGAIPEISDLISRAQKASALLNAGK